jgi:hypothetical protein
MQLALMGAVDTVHAAKVTCVPVGLVGMVERQTALSECVRWVPLGRINHI